MKKIKVDTTITQIAANGYLKPTAPLFTIYNDGDRLMYINNNFLVRPGASYTVNMEAIVAMAIEKNIEVVNDTQYYITFIDDNVSNTRQSAQLIEVFIRKVD